MRAGQLGPWPTPMLVDLINTGRYEANTYDSGRNTARHLPQILIR